MTTRILTLIRQSNDNPNIDFNPPANDNPNIDFNPPANDNPNIDFNPPANDNPNIDFNPPANNNQNVDFNPPVNNNQNVDFNPPVNNNQNVDFNPPANNNQNVDFNPPQSNSINLNGYTIDDKFYQEFLNTGGLNGWLGAPTSEEKNLGGNIVQYFEHGHIYWNGSKAIAYQEGTDLPSNNSGNSPVKPNPIPKPGNPNPVTNPDNSNPVNPNPTNPPDTNPSNPVERVTKSFWNTSFELKNQSLWSNNTPLVDLDWSWSKDFLDEKRQFFGEHAAHFEAGYNAYLSTGGFDANLVSDITVDYPTTAKPGETVRLKIVSDLDDQSKLNTRIGSELNGGFNFKYSYKPDGWNAPLTDINVGSLNWDLLSAGLTTESDGISNNNLTSEGYSDFSINVMDLPNPQIKAAKESLNKVGVELTLAFGPTVTQKTELKTSYFVFNANGSTSNLDFDPNPDDFRTFSYLDIKIPENVQSGQVYNVDLQAKPSSIISTNFGIAGNMSYGVTIGPEIPFVGRVSVLDVNNTWRTPSWNFPPLQKSDIFSSYQSLAPVSIKIS
jgi:LGFP repeat.